MKKRIPAYKRLNQKQRQHVAECFEGPVSKITIARVEAVIAFQKDNHTTCYECNQILRTLKGE